MQYQLQYDNEGTASLKEMDAISTRKVSEGTFKVSDYFAPSIDYGVTETYADTFSSEKQLELIQKKLLQQDGDDGDRSEPNYKKDLSPEFDWKTYSYNTLVASLGEDAANDYLKYSKLEDYAKVADWATLVFPVNYIAKGVIKGSGKGATFLKERITKQHFNSDYYTNKMNAMDLEYKATGDYDSYSDINWGPSYGNEYKEGTVFDAEDEEVNGLMAPPASKPDQRNRGGNESESSGNGPTGHGDAGRAGGESTSTLGSF